MARTHTAEERSRATASGIVTHRKVEIQLADGTWRDYTRRLVGRGGWGEQRDTPVKSATIRLHRGLGENSLAPMMRASLLNRTAGGTYSPALEIGRGVRILTAQLPAGIPPTSGDYREQFVGRIDKVHASHDPIVLPCSGLGAWLMDREIRETATYGSPGGTAIETVLQQVIDANPNGKTTPIVYTPTSPLYYVTNFELAPAKLLDAARQIALRIGWDLRYRYDAGHVDRLTFKDPDRARVTVDATFARSEYVEIQDLTIDIGPIKNTGRWYYRDSAGALHYVTYHNAASVADHGDRYFQVPEQEGIDTLGEAQTAINAAGHDMSGPGAEKAVAMGRYVWFVQLYDRYRFLSNHVQFDEAQILAVAGYQHDWDEHGNIQTTITGTERVVGAYREWRNRILESEELEAGPSLDVFASPGASTYSIGYTASGGPVELSIDGAAYAAAPASPIIVARPAAGSPAKSYAFRVSNAAQTVANEVTVPSIDQDTVTPDLVLTPGVMTDTAATFTATASNPQGGAAPVITVTFRGTSGTIAGVSVPADTPTTAASGSAIVANRPPFGTTTQASITVSAAISGGGAEVIQRTVLNQVKTTFGPSLDVVAAPGTTSYSVAYWAGAAVELSIDGGAYSAAPASPIAVTRPAAGQPDKRLAFRTVADGQTITNEVSVPSIDKDTITPDLVVLTTGISATQIEYTVTASNPGGGAAPSIVVRTNGTTLNGGVLHADIDHPIASGGVILVDRPAFNVGTQASVTFTASLAGGGSERIMRSVMNQVKTTFGPSLDVVATPGPTSYSIAYAAAGGTVNLYINGGFYSVAPASPIVVTRPAAGADPVEYALVVTADGQTINNAVTIQPVDKDTVTPDLAVSVADGTSGDIDYIVTGSNPGGGAAPTITIRAVSTTAYNVTTATAYAANTDYVIASGDRVRFARPAFNVTTQAAAVFRASLSGGGAEVIQRTIANQVKDVFGPTLNVVAAPGTSTYSIDWTATGTPYLSIDGGAWATPPAAPIVVARPAAGAPSKVYAFRSAADGQSISNEVTVPSLDKDTVTPALSVTPSNPTTTTQDFTVTATNPSGGAAPTITVAMTGVDGWLNGVTYLPVGSATTIASGSVVTVNRPAFDTTAQGSVTFVADLAGGGSERIQRTIANQVKTSFGPTLEVTATPGSGSYSLAYSGSGTVELSIDGGSYSSAPASPVIVTRGSSPKQYTFRATLDGQTITQAVTVPAVDPLVGITFSMGAPTVDDAADTLTITYTLSGAPGGSAVNLQWSVDGGASGSATGVSSPHVVSTPLSPGASGVVTLTLVDGSRGVLLSRQSVGLFAT